MSLRTLRFLMIVLVLSLFGRAAFAQPALRDGANFNAWQTLRKLPPAERKAVLEREARREGTLVLYGATGLDRAQFWIGEFNKRYPDIKVEFVRLQGAELYQKIATERRTGQLRADLVITTITYLDLLQEAGALAPYETSAWNDFDPRFRMGGADKGWTAVVYEIFPHAIAWRTDRVASADAPKRTVDLTDPKWRGRMGTTRHLEDFLAGVLSKVGSDKGMELIKGMAAQQNRLYQSHAALSDALAAGEVDVAWGIIAARPIELAAKGAPVAYTLGDPQLAEGNTLSVGRDTTRPYAAALFMDVMLSPEVLEASDRWQPGRIFGNRKGKYAIPAERTVDLYIFPALSPQRYKELNRLAEDLFVR
ncbi:MAG: extracellular solute-binding protein [Casimicrobiaceae bacterium]